MTPAPPLRRPPRRTSDAFLPVPRPNMRSLSRALVVAGCFSFSSPPSSRLTWPQPGSPARGPFSRSGLLPPGRFRRRILLGPAAPCASSPSKSSAPFAPLRLLSPAASLPRVLGTLPRSTASLAFLPPTLRSPPALLLPAASSRIRSASSPSRCISLFSLGPPLLVVEVRGTFSLCPFSASFRTSRRRLPGLGSPAAGGPVREK
mmetsp:Transcript_24955/g.62766  ORF Transcript_24955/g.62766 Transcript_24955/m.62766 type:complete len:204 (-) Transcript_24955:1101-1712(-)